MPNNLNQTTTSTTPKLHSAPINVQNVDDSPKQNIADVFSKICAANNLEVANPLGGPSGYTFNVNSESLQKMCSSENPILKNFGDYLKDNKIEGDILLPPGACNLFRSINTSNAPSSSVASPAFQR